MLYHFYIFHGLEESKRSRDTLRFQKNKGSRKFCRLIHKQDRSLTGIILRISLFVMECTIYGFVQTLRVSISEFISYYRLTIFSLPPEHVFARHSHKRTNSDRNLVIFVNLYLFIDVSNCKSGTASQSASKCAWNRSTFVYQNMRR